MERLAAQPFAALVFGMLFVTLFAPAASAQATPSPTTIPTATATPAPVTSVGGSCSLSKMSFEDVKKWWQVFGESGFQAEEFNAFKQAALQNNQPGNVSVTLNVNTPTQGVGYVNLTEVAEVLGMNPSDAAKALGAAGAEGTVITYQQAEALARSANKQPNTLDRLFGRSLGLATPTPQPWEGYKIRLPSQRDVPLRDLYNLYPISKDECLLDSQDIQGRVEYVGLLDKPLTYGYLRSTSTTGAAQHLTATEADVALTHAGPNGGGANILIPSQYEEWLKFAKFWNGLDMWASLAIGVTAFKGAKQAETAVKDTEAELKSIRKGLTEERVKLYEPHLRLDYSKLLGEVAERDAQSLVHGITDAGAAKGLVNSVHTRANAILEQLGKGQPTVSTAIREGQDRLLNQVARGAAAPTPVRDVDAALDILRRGELDAEDILKLKSYGVDLSDPLWGMSAEVQRAATQAGSINNEYQAFQKLESGKDLNNADLANLGVDVGAIVPAGAGGVVPAVTVTPSQTLQDYLKVRQGVNAQKNNAARSAAELADKKAEMETLEAVYKGARRRLQTSLMVGGLWLGPARFAFTINSAILFQLRSSTPEDKYIQLLINQADIAGDFRRSTNFLGSGTLLEKIGDWTGSATPAKAFTVGEVFLFNRARETQEGSHTSLVDGAIATSWKGKSEATNFEDIRNFRLNDYTSLALESNLIPPNAVIERRDEWSSWTYALGFLAPLIFVRNLKEIPDVAFTLVPFFAATDIVAAIDPAEFKKDTCDPATVNSYKNYYRAATIAGWLQAYAPWLASTRLYGAVLQRSTSFFAAQSPRIATSALYAGTGARFGLKALDYLNAPIVFQWMIGNRAMEYVTQCKDQKYKILAYQQLAAPKADLASKIKPAGDLSSKLNIGDLFKGVGQKVDVSNMPEVLNLRATFADQYGLVQPRELYYFHLDGGNTQWHGAFSRKPDCFQQSFQSKDGTTVTVNKDGITVKDKDGHVKAEFKGPDWGRRALLSQLRQDLAREIVPNKIISTILDCGASVTAFEVDGNSRLLAKAPSCSGVACIQQKLQELTGKSVGEDLSAVLGPVQRVYTSEGITSIENGFARFTRLTAKTSGGVAGIGETIQPAGSERQAPSIKTEEQKSVKQASSLLIQGDASVKLRGQLEGAEVKEESIGQLQTIITSKGRIEYDPSTKELHAALYILAEVLGQQVESIGTGVTKNKDGSPAVTIENLKARPGEEAAVKEFEKAVKKLQQEGGFQQFDTDKNKTYAFGTDENGNPILKIIDKANNKTETLKITGPVTQDPTTGEIRVPTEKGEYRFKIDMQNGVPTLTSTDPNGFKEIAALLAARAPGGILVFDPATGKWQLLNGQDISLNRDFANKGLSLLGSPDGAKGVARDSLLSLPKRPGRETAGLGAFASLPSWPQEPLLFALMLATLVAGVLFVRLRFRRRG